VLKAAGMFPLVQQNDTVEKTDFVLLAATSTESVLFVERDHRTLLLATDDALQFVPAGGNVALIAVLGRLVVVGVS
jgi:hypothetical protein